MPAVVLVRRPVEPLHVPMAGAVLARRPADSLYSLVLVVLIALAFAMQATFVYGLAAGAPSPLRPELVGKGMPAPCVNG